MPRRTRSPALILAVLAATAVPLPALLFLGCGYNAPAPPSDRTLSGPAMPPATAPATTPPRDTALEQRLADRAAADRVARDAQTEQNRLEFRQFLIDSGNKDFLRAERELAESPLSKTQHFEDNRRVLYLYHRAFEDQQLARRRIWEYADELGAADILKALRIVDPEASALFREKFAFLDDGERSELLTDAAKFAREGDPWLLSHGAFKRYDFIIRAVQPKSR